MRWVCALLLLVGGAAAQDATSAAPRRWTGPRGCASRSLQSRARPIVDDVVAAWTIDEGRVRCPPVIWDGVGYVVTGLGAEATLVAFDVRTGAVTARRPVPAFTRHGALVVWDGVVIATTRDGFAAFRLVERALRDAWTAVGVGAPAVHDAEVYAALGRDRLTRLRLATGKPAWTAKLAGAAMGEPAVAGKFVFIATEALALQVEVFRREDGTPAGVLPVSKGAHGRSHCNVSIVGDTMFVAVPAVRSATEYRLMRFREKDGRIERVEAIGAGALDVPPAATSKGPLYRWAGKRRAREWRIATKTDVSLVVFETEQPDLFRDAVAPTVLGDVVYFGSWAMDLQTRDILWRLPIKCATQAIVAVDGLVLVVDSDASLRAFRGTVERGARPDLPAPAGWTKLPAKAPQLEKLRAVWGKDVHGVDFGPLRLLTSVRDEAVLRRCLLHGRLACRVLGELFATERPHTRVDPRLTVLLYGSRHEYERWVRTRGHALAGSTLGHYSPRERLSHVYWNADPVTERGIAKTFVHEVTHHWLFQTNPRYRDEDLRPSASGRWIAEGFAVLMDEGQYDVETGAWTLFDQRSRSLDVVLSCKQLLPWKTVYAMTYPEFLALAREKPVRFTRRWVAGPDACLRARLFYDQGGATCLFLYHGEGGRHRKRLVQFVVDWYTGKDARLTIDAAFGMTPAELGAKVEAFAREVADGWRPPR